MLRNGISKKEIKLNQKIFDHLIKEMLQDLTIVKIMNITHLRPRFASGTQLNLKAREKYQKLKCMIINMEYNDYQWTYNRMRT